MTHQNARALLNEMVLVLERSVGTQELRVRAASFNNKAVDF